ncbi:hypothetical protein [Pseudomonas aeruginosa]|uniref:hypothetical protein n=1 Tax=Pseudomonas aeruginosa TaxID=287 RepID=UPI003EE33FF8
MPELKPVSSLDVCELLRRYRRDLSMRSFPCSDEGDWNLRWTRQEIGRVDRAFSTLQQAELSIPADQVLVKRESLSIILDYIKGDCGHSQEDIFHAALSLQISLRAKA